MTEAPPIVKHGILPQASYDHLLSLDGDRREFSAEARRISIGNYPLFSLLMLENDPTPWFWQYEAELRGYNKQMIEATRGSGKSERYTITESVHDLCAASVPGSGYEDMTILGLFETETKANERWAGVRDKIEHASPNSQLRASFGDIREKALQWNVDGVRLKTSLPPMTQPHLKFLSVGSAVVGTHVRKIIGDDMVSPENSRTRKMRENLRRWWMLAINPTIRQHTLVRIVYTPYFEDDLHADLAMTGAYKRIKIPALNAMPQRGDYEEVFGDDGVTRLGVRLTPQGLGRLRSLSPCPLGEDRCPGTYDHRKEVGFHVSVREWVEWFVRDAMGFKSQGMLMPLSAQDTRIKADMLRFACFEPNHSCAGTVSKKWQGHLEEPVPIVAFHGSPKQSWTPANEVVLNAQCWDHAVGKKAAHDKTSCAFAARTKTNDVFLRWRRGKWNIKEALKRMESFYHTDPFGRKPRYIGSEALSFQENYTMLLSERPSIPLGVICPMKGNSCEAIGLRGLGGTADKDALLVDSGYVNHMVAGKVYLDVHDDEAIGEHLNFSAAGDHAHDDDVDSGRGAFCLVKRMAARTPGFL